MRVLVKHVSSAAAPVDVAEGATVAELQVAVSSAGGIADVVQGAAVRFVFNGRVLRRGEQLSAAGIVSGSTIFVAKAARSAAPPALTNPTREEPWEIVERESPGAASTGLRRRLPTSGCELQITVKRVGDEGEARVALLSTDVVGAIAETLRHEWGVGGARVVHGGRVLDAGANIIDAGLQDGIVVFAIVSGTASDTPPPPLSAPSSSAAGGGEFAGGGTAAQPEDRGPQQQGSGVGAAEEDENTCRFCLGGPSEELGVLFSPCQCSGSMRFVHVECLNRWRRISSTRSSFFKCDTCGYKYQIERTSWAAMLESYPAVEVSTALLCLLLFAVASIPCYACNLHGQFYQLVYHP